MVRSNLATDLTRLAVVAESLVKETGWFLTRLRVPTGNLVTPRVTKLIGLVSGRRRVRDEVSLARTYERGTALKFPEPPFTDSPRSIGAIRTGGELASWGLKQRNCAASLTSRCVTGSVVVYKMLWPAEGTIVISTHGDEKPWLLEARARENGELDCHQLAVLLEWLGQQGISAKNWLERGAF
jgi:hypothetical protein